MTSEDDVTLPPSLLSLSEGGVLYVVNGPAHAMDQTKEAPVKGFTIRVGDKTLLQTWPSSDGQVMSSMLYLGSVIGLRLEFVLINLRSS